AYPVIGGGLTVGANGGPNWRGVAGVSAFGYYSVIYTNTGLYSLGNHHIHSAVTSDQMNIWTTGEAGSTGLKVLNINFQPASGGGLTGLAGSSGAGTRVVRIFNGNVVYSDVGVTPAGLYSMPVGGTSSGLLVAETNSPTDFAISPDANTIYIADNSLTLPPGGIQRWDFDPSVGAYTNTYT